jgi:predicted XRE-type DNA-binding protein
MSKDQEFKSVWDALEDDPVRAQNLKLRSALMIEIREKVNELEITQTQAAKILCISQPRVSALLQGKIERFRRFINELGATVRASLIHCLSKPRSG